MCDIKLIVFYLKEDESVIWNPIFTVVWPLAELRIIVIDALHIILLQIDFFFCYRTFNIKRKKYIYMYILLKAKPIFEFLSV